MKKIEKPLTYILIIIIFSTLIINKLSDKNTYDAEIKIETHKINVDSIINAVLQETENQE